jgi:hypothetical protein
MDKNLRRPEVSMVQRKSCHPVKWFLFYRLAQAGMAEC